jgi:hypothetical protein
VKVKKSGRTIISSVRVQHYVDGVKVGKPSKRFRAPSGAAVVMVKYDAGCSDEVRTFVVGPAHPGRG